MLMMYVMAGALHGICDLDVANNSGSSIVASIKKNINQPEKGLIAEHHCHGCFSIVVPAPIVTAVVVEPTFKVIVATNTARRELSLSIEPPPPKILV